MEQKGDRPPLFYKARQAVLKYQMLQAGDHIVVGLSGGADSTALLIFLTELKKEIPISILAVHVNHQLRGKEADRDQQFAVATAASYGVSCHTVSVEVKEEALKSKISVEEAARILRHTVLEREAAAFFGAKIALAHHEGDVAETVLMRLCRGSGLLGLCGIRPVRGNMIRPFLFVSREEIEAYLTERGVSWITDSTNLETSYTRNKIRLELMPYLQQAINAQAERNIARSARLLLLEEEYLEDIADKVLQKAIRQKGKGEICLDIEILLAEGEAMGTRVLRKATRKLQADGKDISENHIRAVWELLKKQTGKEVVLPQGMAAQKSYDHLRLFFRNEKQAESGFCYPILPGETIFIENSKKYVGLSLNQKKNALNQKKGYTKAFDYDKMYCDFQIRTRRAKDKIYRKNRGTKKIKDYFIDLKIPKQERDKVPLFVSGDTVLWVIGYEADERFLADENTKNILRIAYWEDV